MEVPATLTDERVLNARSLRKYRRDIAVLGDELICLHSNLRLLSQLRAFPSDLFEAPPALMIFLVRNLTTDCVLTCYRIWLDPRRDCLTLKRMGKWLLETAVRPEYRGELKDRIDEATPSSEVESMAESFRRIRHATLAHLSVDALDGLNLLSTPVAFDDLQTVSTALGAYYNSMLFGSSQHFVVAQFHSEKNLWHEGDLGYVLDRVALGSRWFEAPARFPKFFQKNMLPSLTEDELEAINGVRRRHGMLLLARVPVGDNAQQGV